MQGFVQVVDELLDAGAPLQVVVPGHGTALHSAAALLEPDIAELLLSRGGPLLCLLSLCQGPTLLQFIPSPCMRTTHSSLRMHAPYGHLTLR